MKVLTIIKSDLKIIFRDESLSFIMFVPLIFAGLLKFLPPWYEEYLPVLYDYRPLILAFFCILNSALMGFILSFILLDERDQQLFPVFRVMPVTFYKFLSIRVLLIMQFGFLSSLLLIYITGFIGYNLFLNVILSLSASLVGPSSTFIITTIAKNKIEGVTLFKLFNMILFVPVGGLFVKGWLSYLFGIIPYYWIYKGFYNSTGMSTAMILVVALLTNSVLLILSIKFFLKKKPV